MKVLCLLALCFLTGNALAQIAPLPADCTLPVPSFSTTAPNIFNDRQEQDLGDALAEFTESDLRIAAPAVDDQLTRIGERLLAALPPTGIHYTFRIYESGEINGFSLAGGHVYISRKLIATIKNEDELAGVLAHEIGHLYTHQTAIEITRVLRIRLGVTRVSDRADVFAKVHQMFSTPANWKEGSEAEEKDQLAADHVAVYAMVRAGYAADAFASFLDEMTMNKGRTGNWLSDVFGLTKDDAKRYRTALKLIAALPEGCRARQPGTNEAFSAWLRSMVEERVKTAAAGTDGDNPITLDPPLRPSLWRVKFSPDGRFLLAQDDAGISVVDRGAMKVLFRMDALEAEAAQFTPDSENVVFHDDTLRVERWSVGTAKRTSVHEVVVHDTCFNTLLTPDGKTLVCAYGKRNAAIYVHVGVRLIDVESGKPWFDNPTFFVPEPVSRYSVVVGLAVDAGRRVPLVSMIASPDGKYLVIAAGDKAAAFDLPSRQQIAMGGKLKGLSETRMCFLGSDQVLTVGKLNKNRMFETSIFKFPSGEPMKEIYLGDEWVEPVTKGQMLVAGPLKDYAAGIFDPQQNKVVAATRMGPMDAWDETIAVETKGGGVGLTRIGDSSWVPVLLPLEPLPALRAGTFSADGKYLAVSMKNRAAIWSLDTGKEVELLRPFQSAWIDDGDHLYGDFPKYLDQNPAVLQLTLLPFASKELGKMDDNAWQYHDLQMEFKPLGKEAKLHENATLEVKKLETQSVVWSRSYPHETPACWPAEDGRMVLAWDLGNETAKTEIRANPNLQAELNALKNKKSGLLLETVAPETGNAVQQVVIPEADLSHGWNDLRRAIVSGDRVLVRGEHGNTVIYQISDGSKVAEFFGTPLATDSAAGLVAALNREDEILVVDEHTGKELNRFSFGSPVLLTRIVSGNGKTLLVLTADQVVHRMPLEK